MTRQQTVNRTATESRKLEREIGFEPTASSLGNIRAPSASESLTTCGDCSRDQRRENVLPGALRSTRQRWAR